MPYSFIGVGSKWADSRDSMPPTATSNDGNLSILTFLEAFMVSVS